MKKKKRLEEDAAEEVEVAESEIIDQDDENDYCAYLAETTQQHIPELDAIISSFSWLDFCRKWNERINVLRMALCELNYPKEALDESIVLNEAIRLGETLWRSVFVEICQWYFRRICEVTVIMDVFLGIDTSCYTTSICLVDGDYKVIADERRILEVPQGGRGLSQSNMVYQHTRNLPMLFEKLAPILHENPTIRAIGVTDKPRRRDDSYMPAFLAGLGLWPFVGCSIGCTLVYYQPSGKSPCGCFALFGEN